MDMKYHWLRDRISQKQFRHYWAPGSEKMEKDIVYKKTQVGVKEGNGEGSERSMGWFIKNNADTFKSYIIIESNKEKKSN